MMIKQIRIPLLMLLLSLLAALTASPLRAQGPPNYAQVKEVPRAQINDWLKSKIAEHGGDFDNGRYHFILGFSTGHFGQDPVQAIAMHRVAFSLLNNSFAVGDQVTPVAWEMNVWKHGDKVSLTESPDSRAQFVNEVPYAPRENSEGGHDVERALYETLTNDVPPASAASTVVLLLTNTNQSQAPTGKNAMLFGANNSQLKAALQERHMDSTLQRQSFAMKNAQGGSVTVDVTAVFPQKLTSLPDAPASARFPTFDRKTWQPTQDRPESSEALPNPTQEGAGSGAASPPAAGANATARSGATEPAPQPKQSFPLWILLLALLVVIAIIAAVMASRKAAAKPTPKPQPVPVPAARPLPGSVLVKLGLDAPEVVLSPLTIGTRLLLATGEVVTEEEKAKLPNPVVLSTLAWTPDGLLTVNAPLGAEYTDRKGNAEKASDDRRLVLKPGEGLICRLIPALGKDPVRFELSYKKEK